MVPKGQVLCGEKYTGILHFCFWKFGTLVEVVIDDRLPTRGGQLIYTRSKEKNEFWGALLEKALAKLHGSYKAIESGKFCEGSVSLTGGIPEMIKLSDFESKNEKEEERLYKILKKAVNNKAFIGTSLKVKHILTNYLLTLNLLSIMIPG